MEWTHNDEKALRWAQKRDRIRDKLSQGKRWRAKEDADRLVAESISIQGKKDKELDRKQKPVGRDEAMNTAISETHRDKSINHFVI